MYEHLIRIPDLERLAPASDLGHDPLSPNRQDRYFADRHVPGPVPSAAVGHADGADRLVDLAELGLKIAERTSGQVGVRVTN
ncbi:hypothetical protein [Microlunatus sp. GCM10028923]|uniref:hypothetical protein n=1 Tax=Microlunatus sp. GCM10028923 TaxID=3273400 RepID=UPI0036205B94